MSSVLSWKDMENKYSLSDVNYYETYEMVSVTDALNSIFC